MKAIYAYANGLLLTKIETPPRGPAPKYFYHHDGLGSIIGVADTQRSVVRPEVIGSRETEIRHPDPLEPMPGGNYRLTGGTACHLVGDNHHALAYVTTQLGLIADDYLRSLLPVPPSSDHICYNDMSLKWGGKFAIDCSWTGDHRYHHRGRNCDMEQGCVPDPNEEGLERIIESHGGSVQKIPGHWWHLTF